jgi:hypothetical protein
MTAVDQMNSPSSMSKSAIIWLLALPLAVLLAGCGLDETKSRSDKPISPEKASIIGFPFPRTAKEVYYSYFVGGMQCCEVFVRFAVAPGQLEFAFQEISSGLEPEKCQYTITTADKNDKPWFTPSPSSRPYAFKEKNGLHLFLWVDAEKQLIFAYESD